MLFCEMIKGNKFSILIDNLTMLKNSKAFTIKLVR